MPRVRLKHKPAGSLSGFSAKHPDDTYRILASFPTEEGLLVYFEAETENPEAVRQYVAEEPVFHSSKVLHDGEHVILFELAMAEPSVSQQAAIASKAVPRGPLIVRDGWMISNIVTSSERLSQLKDEFEERDITFEVVSVTPSLDPTTLLTDRQREFIIEAGARGYYATPRQCSLTDLAEAMDVTKGSASRVLHRAEGAIITTFISAIPSQWGN